MHSKEKKHTHSIGVRQKTIYLLAALVFMCAVGIVLFLVYKSPPPLTPSDVLAEDIPSHRRSEASVTEVETSELVAVAKTWIETYSATYQYDGQYLKVVDVVTVDDCVSCADMLFSYQTKHPGLGDRTGSTIRVVTEHVMEVHMVDGEVVFAVSDEVFDEYKHRLNDDEVNHIREQRRLEEDDSDTQDTATSTSDSLQGNNNST